MLREGLVLGATGLAIGGATAVGAHRLLRTQLFGVGTDSITVLTTAFVVLGVAAAASYLPARRAASVDPIEALNAE